MVEISKYIYHQKQQEEKCAKQCMNNLLQGPYFKGLGWEREYHKETEEEEERNKLLSDIERIKKIFLTADFELIDVNSEHPKADKTNKDPGNQHVYLCIKGDHWFGLRRFGKTPDTMVWYNLDPRFDFPREISYYDIGSFIEEKRVEGYTIYNIVHLFNSNRRLVPCMADEMVSPRFF